MESYSNESTRNLINAFRQFKQLDWQSKSIEGYNRSEVRVLISIKELKKLQEQEVKVSEISKALRVTPPSITQLLNKLEKDGLVARRMDENDRRVVLVRLTSKGEEIAQKGLEDFFNTFNNLVDALGEEDSEALATLLTKVFIFFSKKDA